MTLNLALIEATANDASEGPWDVDEDLCCVYAGWTTDPKPIAHVGIDAEGTEKDAIFIAAARQVVPALVARVRALTDAGNTLAKAARYACIDAEVTAWRTLTEPDQPTTTEDE